MALLLDSNTLIYFFKNAGAVRSHMSQRKDTEIKLCTPVLWELRTGAFKLQDARSQMARLDAVKTRFDVLTFDSAAAEQAAKARAHLERQGTPIGPVDAMIAGIALSQNLTVITRNTREFERVPGLRVENWFDA